MDAILLCMKKRGIRFFRKINFPTTDVTRFHAKRNFLGLLKTRIKNFDNILIMAHGSNDSILTTTTNPNHKFRVYISSEDAFAFRNDFVFAVSCLTALEFGKQCIDQGAIAYLGFQVELGYLFSSYPGEQSNVPKRVSTAIDIIIKHIFIEELSRAYEEFLRNPINVRTLKERFSFLLEKRIAELTLFTPAEFYEHYGVKFSERDYKNFVVQLTLQVLSYLNDILPHLVCLGDENYLSASYITYRIHDGVSPQKLLEDLEVLPTFLRMSNETYKQHLRDTISKGGGE